jgi:hypothetical protein
MFKFMFFLKNSKKAFTLFTALVSLLLISITLILIFNMTQSEETYLSFVSDQESLSDLITIADLSRADAYDTFIVSLRADWESSYSNSNNVFIINRELIDLNWDSFVFNIVNKHFFESSFSEVFAQTLLNNLTFTLNPSGYDVQISTGYDVGTDSYNNDQSDNFNRIIRQLFLDGGGEVDILNCNQDSNTECVGSFYLTLDTRNLSDANYELLPRVSVLRYKNNEVIERPVLGRQVYKIYMPWRGFQAFRTARRIAYSKDCEMSDNPKECSDNTGVFSPKLHNILEQARLGVCEPNSCGIRSSFFETASSNGFEGYCYNGSDVSIIDSYSISDISLRLDPAGLTYNIDNPSSVEELFENLVKTSLEDRLNSVGYFNNSLDMVGSYEYTDLNISEFKVDISSERTKQSISAIGSSGSINNLPTVIFSNLNDSNINSFAGGLGLFNISSSEYGLLPAFAFSSWSNSYSDSSNTFLVPNDDEETLALKCNKIELIQFDLEFKENDPRYMVNPNRPPNIHIILRDNYDRFRFPYVDYELDIDNYGYLTGDLPDNITMNDIGGEDSWKCYSVKDIGSPPLCVPSTS